MPACSVQPTKVHERAEEQKRGHDNQKCASNELLNQP